MHEPAQKGEYNKAQEKKDLFYDIEVGKEAKFIKIYFKMGIKFCGANAVKVRRSNFIA
jgi:hypothetical protein